MVNLRVQTKIFLPDYGIYTVNVTVLLPHVLLITQKVKILKSKDTDNMKAYFKVRDIRM